MIEEFEIHTMDPDFKLWKKSICAWLNTYTPENGIVSDIFKDLLVAQTLARIIQQNTDDEVINIDEFAVQSPKNYKLIMGVLVQYAESNLFIGTGNIDKRWGRLDGILKNDYASLCYFITQLALFYVCPFPLPPNFSMVVVSTITTNGTKATKTMRFPITSDVAQLGNPNSLSLDHINQMQEMNLGAEKDVYESLINNPEKFQEVCGLLVEFVNTNLQDFGLQINNLQDLMGGGQLILLIGVVGKYYVPLHNFHLQASEDDQRMVNAKLALKLLSELGIDLARFKEDGLDY